MRRRARAPRLRARRRPAPGAACHLPRRRRRPHVPALRRRARSRRRRRPRRRARATLRLASGRPPARAVLLPGALLLVVHHIAFDGASAAVVRRDFAQALDAPLAPPDLTYEAYVAWHAASDGAALRAFWERTLRPAPDAWALPDAAPAASLKCVNRPSRTPWRCPTRAPSRCTASWRRGPSCLHRWTGKPTPSWACRTTAATSTAASTWSATWSTCCPSARVDPERTLRQHVAATSARARRRRRARHVDTCCACRRCRSKPSSCGATCWTDEDGSGGDDLAKTAIEVHLRRPARARPRRPAPRRRGRRAPRRVAAGAGAAGLAPRARRSVARGRAGRTSTPRRRARETSCTPRRR